MRLIEVAVSMYACARVVSTCLIKGHGQMLARVIIRVTACCLAQKGAYFVKDMRIERRHSDFNSLLDVGSLN